MAQVPRNIDPSIRLIDVIKAQVAEGKFTRHSLNKGDVVGMLMASRVEADDVDGDYVFSAFQLGIWGETDALRLMWWESGISLRRIFLLALLIGEGKSDLEEEMAKYFERAVNHFGGEAESQRRKEFIVAKRLGRDIKHLFWAAKEKSMKP